MEILNVQAANPKIDMKRTDPRHFDLQGKTRALEKEETTSFHKQVLSAIEGVNTDQIKASDLAKRIIVDPSVDVHDLTIASAKARMSLDITKNLVERGLQAYREIINMR